MKILNFNQMFNSQTKFQIQVNNQFHLFTNLEPSLILEKLLGIKNFRIKLKIFRKETLKLFKIFNKIINFYLILSLLKNKSLK